MSPEVRQYAVYALGAALVVYMLRRNLWRFLLFVKPTALELEADAPADQMKLPAMLEKRQTDLLALGFVPLGTHLERAPLGGQLLSFDYGHPKELAFATLTASNDNPRLYLFSRAGEAFVLTADYRRPAHEEKGRYLSGSLEGVSVERLFKAHQRRLAELGNATGTCTLEGRVDAGRAWLSGPGASETRQQNLLGLLWTVGTVGMVAAAIFGRVKQ
ncbi:MAG: hypothetical protein QM723_29900 [Myxococcaceae bacterium]